MGKRWPTPYPTPHRQFSLRGGTGRRHRRRRRTGIPVDQALDHVWGYAVGLDMTRRDLQIKMREMGRPWDIGKAFDESAPIGPLHPASMIGAIGDARIWLSVNGAMKQDSTLGKLIWSVPEIIADLSRYFELKSWRPHLHRHARGCGARRCRRPHRNRHRRAGRHRRIDCGQVTRDGTPRLLQQLHVVSRPHRDGAQGTAVPDRSGQHPHRRPSPEPAMSR